MTKSAWNCRLFSDGHCLQVEAFAIRGGRWRLIRFPSMMALLEHPKHGKALFDAGYSDRFFTATKSFPYRLYRWLTPVTLDEESTASRFLGQHGIRLEGLKHLLISHFHADHLGGLRDFPNTVFHCSRKGFLSIDGRSGFAALKRAFLPDLMPPDFSDRTRFIENDPLIPLGKMWHPFTEGRDIFGDQSLVAIDLPGHATGQFGIAFHDNQNEPVFLVADACWMSRAYRENRSPRWLGWFPQADSKAYKQTLEKLHQLYCESPSVRILPTHSTDESYIGIEK